MFYDDPEKRKFRSTTTAPCFCCRRLKILVVLLCWVSVGFYEVCRVVNSPETRNSESNSHGGVERRHTFDSYGSGDMWSPEELRRRKVCV